jgi:acyl-CoA thioesterase-1
VVAAVLAVNVAILGLPMSPRAAGSGGPVRIVAFGDSLTAGYMLPAKDAFPAQLARALEARGHNVDIANAGVSGDTSGSGLERFDWSVPDGTEAVILELGANDALRGIDPALTRRNIEAMMEKLKARNIEILLAGMSAPENWGGNYADAFNALYSDLAARHGAILYPFFLDGVALKAGLNLDDGLHPTAMGVAVIVERILPKAEELVARVEARRTAAAARL